MTDIRNTTEDMRDPATGMAFLAESVVTGSPETFIERQEREGQRQLVNSDRLPSDCDRAEFEALGFTFGAPDHSDPLFMPATLPEGWEKQATDHAMGSVIVDPLGRERVSIFYKAAFYDRSAHMTLIGLGWYVRKWVEYDGPAVIFDDEWATREAVLAELIAARCAETASRKEGQASRYDPHIAKLMRELAASASGLGEG